MVTPVTRAAHRQPSVILSQHGLAMLVVAGACASTALKYVPWYVYISGYGLRCMPCVWDAWQHRIMSSKRGRYSRLAVKSKKSRTLSSPGGLPFARLLSLLLSRM